MIAEKNQIVIEHIGVEVNIGFLNSLGELEYNKYMHQDGGCLDVKENASKTLREYENISDEADLLLYSIEQLKSLEELDCYMQYRWNSVMEIWGGCLTRIEENPKYSNTGVANFIKYFGYKTQTECLIAATEWANKNLTKLKNYEGDPDA